MNRALIDRVANAVLYEGYILYPYRPSVKNRQRWTFGGLYPEAYCQKTGGSEVSANRTECLVRGSDAAAVAATVLAGVSLGFRRPVDYSAGPSPVSSATGDFNGLVDDEMQPAYSAAIGLVLYGLRCEMGIVGSSRNQGRRASSPAAAASSCPPIAEHQAMAGSWRRTRAARSSAGTSTFFELHR